MNTRRFYQYNIFTLGIYFLTWCNRSRAEVNHSSQHMLVPPTWYLVIPAANYWWMWQYAQALEYVSYKRIKSSDTFLFYIVGHLAPFSIAYSVADFIFNINDTNTISGHTLIAALSATIGVFLVLQSIGLGFFCAHMQKRIDMARNSQRQK